MRHEPRGRAMAPIVYRPSDDTEPVAVLRDWLLQHSNAPRYDAPHALRNSHTRPFAPQALLEVAAHQMFRAEVLEAELRNRHPKAKYGRLTALQIAAGIAHHGRALLLSEQLAALWRGPSIDHVRGFLPVVTQIHHGKVEGTGPRDVVLLGAFEAHVGRRSPQRAPDSRITLPKLWWHDGGDETAPWVPMPDGWTLAGNKAWMLCKLELPEGT